MDQSPHLAGQKIRAWREAHALSAEELGERLDPRRLVSRHTIYGWETRGKIAKGPLQKRLAEMGVCEVADWIEPASDDLPAQAAA